MRGTFYNKEIKNRADNLRSQGKTYREIMLSLNIPKSTLSTWLGKKYIGIFTREKQLKHLAATRPLAAAAVKQRIENQNRLITEKVASEIKRFPLKNVGLQKSVLASLYWAEGSKSGSGLKFANTDPDLHRLFITLLRKCFKPDESKFRVHVYVHYYHHINECKKFWSDLLGVSQKQFWKVYVKKRNKTRHFRKNFRGICFLYHTDSRLRKEIMEIAHQLHIHYK